MTLPGYLRIDPGAARRTGGLPLLVRFAPGVSRDAGLAAVASDIKGLPGPYITAAERPANVISLASIAGLPVALAGLLALMAAATLAHTLASSTRRRRRDLAILKSLGFARRQLRHAIAWQATTIAAIALLIGLPIGVAGGGCNPGCDHWPGRSRTAEHQRHGLDLADAHAGEATTGVAGDLGVGPQRRRGFGQPAFG